MRGRAFPKAKGLAPGETPPSLALEDTPREKPLFPLPRGPDAPPIPMPWESVDGDNAEASDDPFAEANAEGGEDAEWDESWDEWSTAWLTWSNQLTMMMMGRGMGRGFGRGMLGKGKGRGKKKGRGKPPGATDAGDSEDGEGKKKGKGKGKGKGKDKGKPQKGKGETRIANGEVAYWGKLKTWDAEKKRGFIMCEEVFQKHAQDVYVFDTILKASGAVPGDTVAFFLHIADKTGFPQVSAPIIRLGAKGSFALKGKFKRVPEKDHGFLECQETHDFFGRDVYVNKDLAALLQPNDWVAFNAKLNADKMPNVVDNVELVDEEWEPTPGDFTQSRTDPMVEMQRFVMKCKSKSMEPEIIARQLPKVAADAGAGQEELNQVILQVLSPPPGSGGKGGSKAEHTGESYAGMIKSFSAENNYGFIASEACHAKYGRDCFFSGKLAEASGVTCKAGEMVHFDVGVNFKGQPQAMGIRMLGAGDPFAAAAASSPLQVPQTLQAITAAPDPNQQLYAQHLAAQQQAQAVPSVDVQAAQALADQQLYAQYLAAQQPMQAQAIQAQVAMQPAMQTAMQPAMQPVHAQQMISNFQTVGEPPAKRTRWG